MEDAHVANAQYDNNPEKALFGVFDGHGGREVAIYCNQTYENVLKENKNLIQTAPTAEQEWLR